ncbi:DUF2953 domain-containing protein [bacterium]|nr:DUF2953 domain-containing protein [bacterium]
MLPVLLCLFFVILIFIFILPYQLGVDINILPDANSFAIHIQSWQNLLGVEWTKKGRQTTIQFRLLKILTKKRIDRFNQVHERLMTKKSTQEKIGHRNWKRTVCMITRVIFHSPQLLYRFMRIFHFKVLSIRGDFGTSNPASTGIVYGLIQSICFIGKRHVRISVRPHFQDNICEGTISLAFRFMLVPLLWWVVQSGIKCICIFRTCRF